LVATSVGYQGSAEFNDEPEGGGDSVQLNTNAHNDSTTLISYHETRIENQCPRDSCRISMPDIPRRLSPVVSLEHPDKYWNHLLKDAGKRS